MPAQRTLLDGDTGAKFDSTELLAGEALAGAPLDVMRLAVAAPTAFVADVDIALDFTSIEQLSGDVPFATWDPLDGEEFTFTRTGVYLFSLTLIMDVSPTATTAGVFDAAPTIGAYGSVVDTGVVQATGVQVVSATGTEWLARFEATGTPGGNITSGALIITRLSDIPPV